MKTKKSKIIQIQPATISVSYHHFKDVTVLRVVRTFNDDHTTVDCARSTSSIYHIIEKRAFFSDAYRTIEHIVHNCNYATI